MKSPVLITGATGLLGGNLLFHWRERSESLSALVRNPQDLPTGAWPGVKVIKGDLSLPEDLEQKILNHEPGTIINCAALTKPDQCHQQPEMAHTINVSGSEAVGRAAQQCGAALVHISTDAVYGHDQGVHREDQAGGYLTIYAQSKLEAEKAVLRACPQALVLRTCLFGWNTNPTLSSLAEWIVDSLRAGTPITGFTDIAFNPVSCTSLARLIPLALESSLQGVYNVGSAEGTSKHYFAVLLAESLGLDSSLIVAGESNKSPLAAPRARSPVMAVEKFYGALGIRPPTLAEEVAEFKNMEQTGQRAAMQYYGGWK